MVFHAGIGLISFPYYVAFYDTDTKNITEFKLEKEICEYSSLRLFLEDIKLKIDGCVGCLCIALSYAIKNTRKEFINSALKIGFKKVKLIEQNTAFYYHAVCHSIYVPKNEDNIWIYDGDRVYIWHKQNDKAKFLLSQFSHYSKEFLKELLHKARKPPNVIMYQNAFNKAPATEMFPKCQFFEYSDGPRRFWNRSALIQARIMAGDRFVMKYDAYTVLSQNLCIITKRFNDVMWFMRKLSLCKTEEDELKINGIQRYIRSGNNLPISKTAVIRSSETKNILSVVSEPYRILQITSLPINKTFDVTMAVDENGIFNVDIRLLGNMKPKKSYNKKFSIPYKFAVDNDENPKIAAFAVGIDLGTTRCCAAVNRKNGMETVALDNSARLLPSYVAFDEEKEKCGQIVVNRLRYFAKYTVFDSKRIIGKKFESIKIDQNWPFELLKDKNLKLDHLNEEQMLQFKLLKNNDTFIKIETKNGQQLKYPEEISAILLKHIKQKVEEFQGNNRIQAMISVPTTFTDSQKDATCVAAILAGYEIVDFVPEPVAAAFAYLVNQPVQQNFNFLLFDLGGGTLDVCIFKCEKRQIQILSQDGNSNLGGRDFDNILIDYFLEKFYNEFGIKDLDLKKYKLMLECQKIKENLSVYDEEYLEVEEIMPSIESTIKITRKKFEELSTELLKKVKTCITNAMENSNFCYDQIDKILLVGGGSRMPMIKNLLKNLFTKAEHCTTTHPDEVVAIGAAYYAYYLESLLKHGEKLELLKGCRKRKCVEKNFVEEEDEEKNMFKKFKLLSLN